MFFSLKYLVNVSAIATISCPTTTCFVGNCQCGISGCLDGLVYIYDANDCGGSAILKPSFQGSSFNWSPERAIKYYLVVRCSNQDTSACTEVTVSQVSTTTSTVGSTTTVATTSSTITTGPTSTTRPTSTTTIGRECSYDNPCPADCGKRKLNQATNNQNYYTFVIDSISNVTIRLEPDRNVDYDLYVNWDESEPTKDQYDCRPSKDIGTVEECKNSGLLEGTYYVMVNYLADYSLGPGSYNLSISCTPMGSVSASCSNQDQPCKIDCGKSKVDRSTNTRDYFMFKLSSKSNVTVKLFPTSNVDYDLYVNWDGKKPSVDKYDCKSSSGEGEKEECSITNLEVGNYYIMTDFYEGIGTYDLSLSCSPIKVTTTTTISSTTTATTAIATTSVNISTTIKGTTTTTKNSSCGTNGYCESTNNDCNSGYEDCPDNDVDCSIDQKCCCVTEIHPEPSNLGLVVGLVVILLIVVLVYFFIKGKSRITFEKLYRKWSR